MKFVFQIEENVHKDPFYLYDNILFSLLPTLTTVLTRKTRHVVTDIWVIVGNVGHQLFLGVKVLATLTTDHLGTSMDILVVAVHGPDGHEAAVAVGAGKVAQLVLMAVVFVTA